MEAVHSDRYNYAVLYRMAGGIIPSLLYEDDDYMKVLNAVHKFLKEEEKRIARPGYTVYSELNLPHSASVVRKNDKDKFGRDVRTFAIVRIFTPKLVDFARYAVDPEYAAEYDGNNPPPPQKENELDVVTRFKPCIREYVVNLLNAGNPPGDILWLFDSTIKTICVEENAYAETGWLEGNRCSFSWPTGMNPRKR